MVLLEYVKQVLILGPILALLALGLWITVRSGVANLGSGQYMRQIVGNLSQTVLLVTACLVGLAIIQRVIGFKLHIF